MLCLQDYAPNADSIQILLIENHDLDAHYIRELLSFETSHDWQIETVPSLCESLHILKQKHFDVILLDLSLPDSVGIETVQKVLLQEHHIPVVVISDFNNPQLGFEAVQMGVQDVVLKDQLSAEKLSFVISCSIYRQQLINRVNLRAEQDSLTELYNRKAFMQALQEAFETPNSLFGLMFIDLDDFKYINDHHGHHVGDQVLTNVAKRLNGVIRKGDMVARLGGDEFCILIHGLVDHLEILPIINRVSRAISSDIRLDNDSLLQINASIGIALSNLPCTQSEELLVCSDLAMYHAKKNGKGFHFICTPNMYYQREYLQQFEKDMQVMNANQELEVVYQPIVHLKTGWIFGVQASPRSQHPRWKSFNSSEFSSMVISASIQAKIRDWLLSEVAKQVLSWQSRDIKTSHLNVFLKLSHQELTSQSLAKHLETWVQNNCLDPHCIWLSVQESLFDTNSRDLDNCSCAMKQLQELGFQMYIDHFAAKSVSVDLFSHVNPKIAKIDLSAFQNTAVAKSKKEYILKIMIEMCHQLQMDVLVNGVENPEDLPLLKELGCDYAMGSCLFPELSPLELEGWLV